VAAAAAKVGAALAATPPDLPARRFLEQLDIPAGAREALLARVEISSANSADLVSARDLDGLAHVDDDPAPSVAGGNQRLALGLAARLGEAVRLSSPVERIAWEPEPVSGGTPPAHAGSDLGAVRVHAAGAELEADACVVAVPAAVLGRIAFDPPLPADAAEALAGVRYGHAAKLFVPLRPPAPVSAVMAVPERYWCWTACGDGGEVQRVVSCFAGSAGGLERLGVADGPERWLDSLASLRADLELDPSGALLSTWADDPWAGAAYSTSPPLALAERFARPVGPLAFAGEHLGGEFAALMEGAIRSGRRAAAVLLGSPSGVPA